MLNFSVLKVQKFAKEPLGFGVPTSNSSRAAVRSDLLQILFAETESGVHFSQESYSAIADFFLPLSA